MIVHANSTQKHCFGTWFRFELEQIRARHGPIAFRSGLATLLAIGYDGIALLVLPKAGFAATLRQPTHRQGQCQ